MAWSCSIGRICSPALKVQIPISLKNDLFTRSASLCFVGQPSRRRLTFGSNPTKEKFTPYHYSLQSTSPLSIVKSFSTSQPRLGDHKGHDHSKIWTFEKMLSLTLLPLVPAALLAPCQQLDTAMALAIVLHTHFGLEAIVVDYVRPILFGELAPKIGLGLLYLFSIVTFAGLLNLIYNDTGLANTILNVWKK